MYEQTNPNELPGIGTSIVSIYKPIWFGKDGVRYQPGGGTIDGNNARDPSNVFSGSIPPRAQTTYYDVLQPGLLLGKLSSGYYGASIFGSTTAAITASATSFKVSIAVGQEIIRRLGGVTGSLTLTGPAVANTAPVNQQTVTVTNIAATGDGSTYTVTLYAGVTYAAVAGSLVQPADGSQIIKTFVDEEDGIRVADINGNGLSIQFPRVPIAGEINTPNIVNCPSDTALLAWVKAALVATGLFQFSDNF
jgi:hypothetical protein